jgi:prophage DNA circulation protein
MSWRDALRRVTMEDGRRLIGATFRGVPFFVEQAHRTGGRRIVAHEFPLRDDPYVEDLGRRARTFAIEGYVLGEDYVEQRDALLAALEDVSGPGELVHPYHGVRRVICASLSVRETIADGGMVRFSLEFQEAPAQSVAPTEQVDEGDQVEISADLADAATDAELAAEYDVDGMPGFAVASSEAALEALAEGLETALAPVVSETQELARMTVDVRALASESASLVRAPDEVLGRFREVLEGLAEAALESPGAVVRALLDTYGTDTGPAVLQTTATREQEAANLAALVAGLRRVLVIAAARLAVAAAAEFETLEEATDLRDEIAELLEEQAEGAGDEAYPALVQLRADLVRAVPGSAVLARLQTVSRPVPVPSVVLAYQLYGSTELEGDIVARNEARHPGFLVGELEVLSDG